MPGAACRAGTSAAHRLLCRQHGCCPPATLPCLHPAVHPAPPLPTHSTLIIACNMCNQPREAMAVYRRMLEEGYSPNSTTYNALISAYGKAGQLDKVMEVFQVGGALYTMSKGQRH